MFISATSERRTLEVVDSPRDIRVDINGNSILYCSFKGSDIKDIVWQKENGKIPLKARRVLTKLNVSLQGDITFVRIIGI